MNDSKIPWFLSHCHSLHFCFLSLSFFYSRFAFCRFFLHFSYSSFFRLPSILWIQCWSLLSLIFKSRSVVVFFLFFVPFLFLSFVVTGIVIRFASLNRMSPLTSGTHFHFQVTFFLLLPWFYPSLSYSIQACSTTQTLEFNSRTLQVPLLGSSSKSIKL